MIALASAEMEKFVYIMLSSIVEKQRPYFKFCRILRACNEPIPRVKKLSALFKSSQLVIGKTVSLIKCIVA